MNHIAYIVDFLQIWKINLIFYLIPMKCVSDQLIVIKKNQILKIWI